MSETSTMKTEDAEKGSDTDQDHSSTTPDAEVEIGGPKGPEPTRFGDWEKNGRCSDF